MSDAVRRRVVIRGRVQGVFFRDTARREAQRRSVAGWICNRADGAVEAVFEGGLTDVEALVDLCQKGPRGAHVERVEASEEEPQGLHRFEVR
jgi:acylphosphatase